MEECKKLVQWIKDHKKQLIIAGISVGTLILIILRIKSRATINAVWDSLKGVVKNLTAKATENVASVITESTPTSVSEKESAVASNSETIPYEVSRHIRNLPDGWHASLEKVEEALKNNIVLMDGQTWVKNYVKGCVAA